jgi:hypothetical protein
MLGPKESNTQKSSRPSKGDEALLSKTKSKISTSSHKPSNAATDKLEEPQPDNYAITSLIKQGQSLYTQLNADDRTQFGHYDEQDQTGYANVDIDST